MSIPVVEVRPRLPSRLLKRKKRVLHDLPPDIDLARSSKKAKLDRVVADDLPWKEVARPAETGFDDDGGILMLEEVEGVEVIYEGEGTGRVAKFKIKEGSQKKGRRKASSQTQKEKDKEDETFELESLPIEDFDVESLLPAWKSFSLHPNLLKSLHDQNFVSPTPIQSAALAPALEGRDVVGVAETGSGKTLAYGLPILHHLLRNPQPRSKRCVKALIVAPTRELALQVSVHLNKCVKLATTSDEHTSKGPPRVSIAAIVGGMSAQKQRRVLDRGLDVLVATPGRLWDILGEDDELAQQIKSLRFLVLDEADRMIETGHFVELDNILRLTIRPSEDDLIEPENAEEATAEESPKDSLQTFIFSATLSKELQRNLSRRPKAGSRKKKGNTGSTLDDLLLKLDFRDTSPQVIDLSPQGGVVSTLKESRIECLSSDKDAYLYYFLIRYPGRSLVFLSAIDGIRRLAPLLELLDLKVWPLHSQLEQKQRLKNLDRFKSTPNSVLLATDVAARGLDIPSVDHVIHYQIPRSTDVYVHRNGRTARAMRQGFSLLLCGPEERRIVRSLLSSLGRQDTEIPDLDVEHNLLDKLKPRIAIAKKIDAARHKVKKQNHERNWMKEAAEAMEIEIDEDLLEESENAVSKRQQAQTAALKAELRALLSQPLIARGISTKYLTSGSRSVVDDLVAGSHHESMLGLKNVQAGEDVVARKLKRPKMKQT